MGSGRAVLIVASQLQEMPMLRGIIFIMVMLVFKRSQCYMLIKRNTCFQIIQFFSLLSRGSMTHVGFKKWLCRFVKFSSQGLPDRGDV